MKDINKLIKKARQITISQQLGMYIAFINLDEDRTKYVSKCHLWDGVHGGRCSVLTNEHDSKEAAEQYVGLVGKKYPYKNGTVVFFDVAKGEELYSD